MPLELALLTGTPDIRCIPPVQAGLVGAFRYTSIARRSGRYAERDLARYLGSAKAVLPFHAFADEIGRAWPDPIFLNPPCQPLLSYDEMLIVDIAAAAANADRHAFGCFLEDMLSMRVREGVWRAARRLVKHLPVAVREEPT